MLVREVGTRGTYLYVLRDDFNFIAPFVNKRRFEKFVSVKKN